MYKQTSIVAKPMPLSQRPALLNEVVKMFREPIPTRLEKNLVQSRETADAITLFGIFSPIPEYEKIDGENVKMPSQWSCI